MTLKLNSQALEPLRTKDTVGTGFRSYLLDKKVKALSRGKIIPDDLIAKIEEFKDRNAIVELKSETDGKICCQQCLKAFALKKAYEIGLDNSAIKMVAGMFNGKTGHDGYYLDGGKLMKI